MTISYTPHFHLAVPDFLSEPWHAEFAQAMQSIDDALYGVVTGTLPPAPIPPPPVLQPVGFSAHKNGADQLSVPSNLLTKVTCGTELYDAGGHYDTALSRWTPPQGMVNISGGLYVSTGLVLSSNLNINIFKNGTQFKQATNSAAGLDAGVSITIDDTANGTDFYELFVLGSAGTTFVVNGGVTLTWFMGH